MYAFTVCIEKVLDGEWENVGYGNSWSQGTVHAAHWPAIWMPRREPLWKPAVVRCAALTAGLCAMLILMPAKMLWLFLITHLNLRERRDGVCVVRFVIYSCYSEFK